MTIQPAPTASEIDQHVGERIRRRRILLGLTQDQLGDALGISYQQIQKYETGVNRVSAGRLYQIAQHLKVSVDELFGGLDTGRLTSDADSGVDLAARHVIDLVRAYSQISEEHLRLAVLSLVRAMAREEPSQPIDTLSGALNGASSMNHRSDGEDVETPN